MQVGLKKTHKKTALWGRLLVNGKKKMEKAYVGICGSGNLLNDSLKFEMKSCCIWPKGLSSGMYSVALHKHGCELKSNTLQPVRGKCQHSNDNKQMASATALRNTLLAILEAIWWIVIK